MWDDCEMQSHHVILSSGVYGVSPQVHVLGTEHVLFANYFLGFLARFPKHAESAIAKAHPPTKLNNKTKLAELPA